MQHLALARKWRPKTFSEVVGQAHVVEALSHALAQQRLHHAYLFAGTRGVGKTTLGRIFAKALNCEQGVTPEPCGRCEACQAIDEGRFVDLIEIDAASRTKVEDTRELLDNVQFLPTAGRFKVYLIDEVHMLSSHSFNALLKTLEEPPEHVKFILATTDPHKLPITVLSRCLKFNLLRLMPATIAAHLQRVAEAEGIEITPAALQLLAYHADGSVRDALSLLDQAIAQSGGRIDEQAVRIMLGLTSEAQLEALLSALAQSDTAALGETLAQLATQGVDYALLLDALVQQFHLISLLQLLGQAAPDQDARLAEQFVDAFSPERVQVCYQTGLLGQKDLQWAPDARTAFEMTVLRMLAFEPVPFEKERGVETASVPQELPKRPQNTQKPDLSSAPSGAEKPTSEKTGGPPVSLPDTAAPPLDDSPLVEAPTGEAALQGEAKQSRFAQMLAQFGSRLDEGKPAAEAAREAVSAQSTPDPAPVARPVVEETSTVSDESEPTAPPGADAILDTAWLAPEQWAATIEEQGLDGLVRTLAEHCVAARTASGWQLAVAPEQAHLQRTKGADLAARLGEVAWVDWPEGQQSVAQWREKRAADRKREAKAAFMHDPAVRRVMALFDAKVIEASIQPKDSN